MATRVVHAPVVEGELELDPVAVGQQGKAVGEVEEPEAASEDLLDVVAVEDQGELAPERQGAAQSEARERIQVLGRAGGEESLKRVSLEQRDDAAGPHPRLLSEVLQLLGPLREAVGPGLGPVAGLVPDRDL